MRCTSMSSFKASLGAFSSAKREQRSWTWIARFYRCGASSSGSTSIDSLADDRSEEHTSELQSRQYLVCRLLLEKKNARHIRAQTHGDAVLARQLLRVT